MRHERAIKALGQVRTALDLLTKQHFKERDAAAIAGHALASLDTVAGIIREMAPMVRQPADPRHDAEGRS